MDRALSVRIEALRAQQGLALSRGLVERLSDLAALVTRWNRQLGLVGFADEEAFVKRYVFEALAASEWLPREGRIVDVGSGGGSPALPMALRFPNLSWCLLEANQRRCVFLEEAIHRLGLTRVEVVATRWEKYAPGPPVNGLTCRGVRLRLEDLILLGTWVTEGGRMILMTGERRSREFVEDGCGHAATAERHSLAPDHRSWAVVVRKGSRQPACSESGDRIAGEKGHARRCFT